VSATTASRAELAKLARLLRLDGPETLAFAQDAPAAELCDYREAVTDLLYDDDRALLQRAADAARLLPASTLAAIGEHSLGSLICAHLTGLLDPERAVEISQHFPIDFLAQLAAELDPRRAVAVVTAMPPERVLEIALAMIAHGEHVAMGRFVAQLETGSLTACLEALSDEDLLRVGFVLEGKERLPEIFELLGLERAQRMLDRAESLGLGEEASDLLDHLDARQRKQLRARGSSTRRSGKK
jgi:hypothetical protein